MVSPVAFAGPGTISPSRPGPAETRDQFLRLLVAQLSSQDPLDPVDNGDFMQQIAALQTVEQTAALAEGLRSFENFFQLSSGGALIGRTVAGLTAAGQAVSGVVSSVALENGAALAVLADGTRLPLSSLTEVF